MSHPSETKEGIVARATELYGEPLGPMRGVLHVVAVAREEDGLRVMWIGEHSPKSDTDFFALQLARARVDAILVSGSVLRAEPGLRYDLVGGGWDAYRGGRPPPLLCVLTRRGGLPASHPVWGSWARPFVFTGDDAPLELPAHVPVVRVREPTPRGAIHHLVRERGCASVSIEAGPRVALPLYDAPSVVDELMLSTFEGELDPRARGAAFLEEAELATELERVAPPFAVEEPSGPWTFRRFLSRARRGTAEGSR